LGVREGRWYGATRVGRLDRYLLRATLAPLGFAIGFVVVTVFLFQAQRLVGAAIGLGLTAGDALVIFVSALPPFLVLAIPLALLMAVIVALGRLSTDREVVALLAAGASPWRIARIPIAVGALVTALSLPLAHLGEPLGQATLYDRLVDVGLRNISRAVRPGVFNEDFSSMAIYARTRADDGKLSSVLLYDERDPARPIVVTAARGALAPSASRGLVLDLDQGEIHLGRGAAGDSYERVQFEHAQLGIDVERDLVERTRFLSELSRMPSGAMLPAAAARGDTMWSRRVEKSFWRRSAVPAMGLVFALVGAAIVLSTPSKARARQAVLALLAVVGYYVLLRVGDIAVLKSANAAFWAAWVPNAVMLAIGVFGLSRAGKPS